MSKSLQDQLLALGLAKAGNRDTPRKPQVKKPRGDNRAVSEKSPGDHKAGGNHSNRKQRPDSRPASRPDPKVDENISLEQAYRIREAEEKSAKQRARERKLEEDRKRAALNRQIRQIIDGTRLNLPDAAEARYFMYKGRIRKVHVSPEQLSGLNSGELGVVYLAGGYHILHSEHIEEVFKLSPGHVPDLLSGGGDDSFDEADFAADELRGKEPANSDSESDTGTDPEEDPDFADPDAATARCTVGSPKPG